MSGIYETKEFEASNTYTGNDLGVTLTPEKTLFRLWAPTAKSVDVQFYHGGDDWFDDRISALPMKKDRNGTWTLEVHENLSGIYYTYQVDRNGTTVKACDPYARTTGVNGRRAMVIDLESTNPRGWERDANPQAGKNITDAIIYEVHMRDISMGPESGIQNKGKYLGLAENSTHTRGGIPTGLDHIKALGITHVQLMPVYDYGSVDEAHPEAPQYNWGYDPVNFNVPEGSYATDAFRGEVRVKEMKQMVQALHANGLGVVMDVVYNHVYHTDEFCFNQIVPGYFSRPDSNGSGCGNDTASERAMVRKYIVDSVNYWADEYHIDGFRFDLVGLIDIETIRQAMETVKKKHPDCIFYGEGWDMPTNVTRPGTQLATQRNSKFLPGFGFFNDTIRDTLRGSVFSMNVSGFAAGGTGYKEVLEKCFLGAPYWTDSPPQCINYVSCHDNHTLLDRLAVSLPKASREELIRRNNLAAAFTILSQGVPFFLAGEEMLRSKQNRSGKYLDNTYNVPDSVNALKWNRLKDPAYQKVLEYYKGLIAFRKAFPALRLTNSFDVHNRVHPLPTPNDHTLAFTVMGQDYRLVIIFNAGSQQVNIPLPKGDWALTIWEDTAGIVSLENLRESVTVPPATTAALIQWRDP